MRSKLYAKADTNKTKDPRLFMVRKLPNKPMNSYLIHDLHEREINKSFIYFILDFMPLTAKPKLNW